jgi:phosphatidylserine/phosphatidylglycerophosphate/cardiolipin synthase-like enzyme
MESDHCMRRRSSRKSQPSRGRLLLILVVVLGVGYIFWRYPETAAQLFKPLLSEPSIDTNPPPPIAAQPTAPGAEPAAQPAQPQAGAAWYQLFFTTPRYPDKPEYHHGGIDTQLVDVLNTATKTLDIAIYDFDLENVAEALAQAAGRGVRVRMVTDTDTLTNRNAQVQRAFAIVKRANIPIVDDQRPAIMHNKFVVIDNQAVWTGSWNFTDGDTYHLNNNAIRISVPELAQNYTLEFEKMFVQHEFGPAKPESQNHPVLQVGDVRIENYFAPEDNVAARVSERLKQAKRSIHFLAFSFTNDAIGKAVQDAAKAGVQVSGVFETTGSETQFSEYGKFKKLKMDVLQDGNPYVMHHKVFIIDGATVIFGSFNFSNNADQDNDENLLMIDDPQLAQAFEAEFQRVREQALNPPKRK